MNKKEKIKINGMLLLTALLWGSAYAVRKIGFEYMGPFFLNSWRFLTAFIFVMIIYIMEQKKHKNNSTGNPLSPMKMNCYKSLPYQIGGGVLVGIVLSIGASLQQWGLTTTDAGKVSFITSLYIIFVPLISWLILKKKIKKQVWAGAVMAFLGVAFLSADGNFQISAADTAVFISAVLFAVQIILLGYFIQYSNPLLLVAAEMFTGFAISLLFSALFETGNSFSGAMAGIGPILFTGLGSLGIANIIQSYAQKKASPSVAAIILSFESVFGAIFGIILLNERLNAFQSIGCILIFLALLVSQYEKQSKEKQV